MSRARRSSLLLLVLILFTLLPSSTPAASATRGMQTTNHQEAPPAFRPTLETPSYPRRPGFALTVTAAPETVTLGDTATITLTLTNRAPHPAEHVVMTLPLPNGMAPLPGDGFVSATTGWRWFFDRLDGQATVTKQAQVRVIQMPHGGALLGQAQAMARDLPEPARAVGGVRVMEREVTPATTRFTPGRPAQIQSADGHVTVHFPAQAADRALTLRASRLPQAREALPTSRPGWKRGWGTVFLTATDDAGEDVHHFAEPVTITLHYTPEELQALDTTEADLTIFWFDETEQRWMPQPTRLDPQTLTASTTVDHFSAYQLSDGSSSSAAYIPSLQGFQVSSFTGAASYSIPIEVPAGAGGLKPSVELSYSSATSDGTSGARDKWQASWVGKGWTLDPAGSVSVNKSLVGDGWNHYSFVFGGRSFDAVRGQLLPPYTDYFNDRNPAHWSWHAADENFTKVRAEDLGNGSYRWLAWDKGGTRYSFTTPLTTHDSQQSYVYKWLLTEVTDVHGNRIVYDYHIDTDVSYQPTAYLSAIHWGFDGTTPGTGTARYKIAFQASPRWAWPTEGVDLQWEYPTCATCGTYWSRFTAHEAYRLNAINVLSMQPGAAGYELVRQYRLGYADTATSVQADRVSGQRVLTLTSVQEVGKDGTSVLPATTFTYVPTGQPGANRLQTITNGQGGKVQFTYERVWPTPPAGECACLYENFFRVKEVRRIETANPSAPIHPLTTYEYQEPALNDSTSAATVVYAMYPPSGNGDSRSFLARQEQREFRGHARVIERQYADADPATTLLSVQEHWFHQGKRNEGTKADCPIQITNGKLVEDACFQQMVEHEAWKGREYQTETRAPNGTTVLQRTTQTFVRQDLPFFGSDSSVVDSAGKSNHYKRAGLWRAFSSEREHVTAAVEGSATPVSSRTRNTYDPALQGGRQYGNLTTIEEFAGSSTTPYRVTQHRYATRDDASAYLVDRSSQEIIKDGQGRFLALNESFFDGSATHGSIGTRGLTTLVRKYLNVPLQTSTTNITLLSSDTSYTYDAYGNRVSETTYAEAGTRLFNGSTTTYSAAGNGSAAYTSTTTYDNTFHAFSVQVNPPAVNGVTLTERAEYDYRMGTLTKVIDANNVATQAEYDVFGRMVKLIKPSDSSQYPTVEAVYDDFAQPFRYVLRQREVSGQPGYRSTQTFYDGWGRTIQTKRESQNLAQTIVTDQRYDAAGNVVAESQPRYVNETGSAFGSYTLPDSGVRWTTTSYDVLNRPLEITRPDGTKERHRYFLQNGLQLHDYVDANRHRTVTRTDAWGRRVQVDEFAGDCSNAWSAYACAAPSTTAWTNAGTTTYRYTPLDLLDQVADALGNVTTMTYDSLGRKLTMSDPDMGSWSYQYDVSGSLLRQTDAKGQTTVFQYDPLNRLTAKTSPDGRASYYGYDEAYGSGKGQRTSMSVYVNGAQQSYTSFYYDERGRNSNRGHLVAGMSGARHFAWTYDSADRVTSLTYPSGETVSYTYDQAWRQTSVCSSLGGCYATTAQYTALDQPLALTFGNTLPQTWQYTSPMQRLNETYVGMGDAGSALHKRYSYDNAGNVSGIEDRTSKAATTQTFTYDHRDRLTSVTGPTTTDNDTFTYDAIGNLLQKGGQTYQYGANGNGTGSGPHQVRTKGGWAYTYDANGNLTGHNGRTYTWNSDNLPSRITIPNIADETYTYDANGERLTRTVNGVTTVYLAGIWEEEIQTGVTRSHYALQGKVVAQRSSSSNQVLYLHSDHLGSVSAVTDANGLLVNKQDFTPWGEIRGGGTGVTQTSLNFTGQRRDSTGLLYYHARYYDPNLGRFLSADSVVPGTAHTSLTVTYHATSLPTAEKAPPSPGNPQALNRFAYVLNNPLTYTDPSGHTVYLSQSEVEAVSDSLTNVADQIAADIQAGAGFENTLKQLDAAVQMLLNFLEATPVVGMFVDLFGIITDQIKEGQVNWEDAYALQALAHQIDDVAEHSTAGVAIGARVGEDYTTFYVLNRSDGSMGKPVKMRTSTFAQWFDYRVDLGQAYGDDARKGWYFVIDKQQSGSWGYNPWGANRANRGAPICSSQPRHCDGQDGWEPGQDF
jgi:RHS repeat-associated protein/uncharacterized repeat protein (TIGR01451 family)